MKHAQFIVLAALSALLIEPSAVSAQWNLLGDPIEGVAGGDLLGFRNSIAIDSVGTTVAVGSRFHDPFCGYAKVFDWDGNDWVQRGATFTCATPGNIGLGAAVDLSADGNIVVISSPWDQNSLGFSSGVVDVYEWNGSTWQQRGSTIEGEGNPNPLYDGDIFGSGLALSPNGEFLAIGAPANTQETGVLQIQGHVRVYQWNGSEYVQMGQDIDGVVSLEDFGRAVDISDDGVHLAVGGKNFNLWQGDTLLIAQEIGIVRTYSWDGSDWVTRADSITGMSTSDGVGSSVSLNDDGNVLAVSAKNLTGTSSTQVYDWLGNDWVLRGDSILGSDVIGPQNDLSADGNILAVGEPGSNFFNGSAKVFNWNGSSWVQIDNTLLSNGPSSAINAFGSEIALNWSGSRVLVGSPQQAPGGQVYVFRNPSLEVSTGIGELGNEEILSIYPNPANDLIVVEMLSEQTSPTELEVFDIMGRSVMRSQVQQAMRSELDVSALSPGQYMLRIRNEANTYSHKFFVAGR